VRHDWRMSKGFAAFGFLALATGLSLWAFMSHLRPPKLTEGRAKYEVFFRLKASYTYKSAAGPIPWSFDVVAGCGVEITKYVAAGVSSISSRSPTIYALPTGDGHALGIEVPKACSGQTTANKRVPQDFFPAVVYYEKADDLAFGLLYHSEDAYDGPLSKLTFHGATISAATKDEFKAWLATDGKKNLISDWSSADSRGPENPYPKELTEELIANPGAYWKADMPKFCYGVTRLKMPENLKAYIRQVWDSKGPRYWAMGREKTQGLLNYLLAGNGFLPGFGETLFNGREIGVYGLVNGSSGLWWGTGLVNRSGGGSFGAVKQTNPPFVNALPADYFPLTMSEGLPWLKDIDPNVQAFTRNVEIGDERKKGFSYCFSTTGNVAISAHFIKTDWTKVQGPFPAELHVDGQLVEGAGMTQGDVNVTFFDRDDYIFFMYRALL
jgi:hypothetical protein